MLRGQQALKQLQTQTTQTQQTVTSASTDITAHANRTGQALQRLGTSLVAVAAAAVSLRAIGTALTESVQASLKLEGLQSSFKAITGSSQGAAQAIGFIRTEAERLGLVAAPLTETYKTFLAAVEQTPLRGDPAQQVFLGMAEASTVLKLASEETSGAIRALTQIVNQGVFQMDEYRNEFGSRIPGAMQLLLQATNGAVKNQEELAKAFEQGRLKGQAAYDIVANLGELLRTKYAAAAIEAAQSTQGAFNRLLNTITQLQEAFGAQLAPALSAAADAFRTLLMEARPGTEMFGPAFTMLLREATSALVGMAGGVIVLAKAWYLLHAPMTDFDEIRKRFASLTETFTDLVTVQQMLVNPPNLTRLRTDLPKPPVTPPTLREVTLPGGEGKGRAKQSEAETALKNMEDTRGRILEQMQRERDLAGLNARATQEAELILAGFSDEKIGALMTQYDETMRLNTLRDEATDREAQRTQLAQQQQDALDKVTLSEREIFQLKLATLQFNDAETKFHLDRFDLIQQTTREQKELTDATEAHAQAFQNLLQRLEPRRRFLSKAEERQAMQEEIGTSDLTEFERAQADVKLMQKTAVEDWDTWRQAGLEAVDDVSSALSDFVFRGKQSFGDFINSTIEGLFRLAAQQTFKALFNSDVVQGALKSVGVFLSAFGGSGGAATTAGLTNAIAGTAVLRQSGGPAYAGTPYVVGEAGPEIFVPAHSGMVIPNAQTMGLAAPNITINVHGVQDAQSFMQSRGAIQRAIAQAVSGSYRAM